jgi:DNA replication and repair protein RecF
VNRVAAKSAAALSQVFNTVFFCPEDLSLIRDGAAPAAALYGRRPVPASAPATPRPSPNTAGRTSTRPASCGTARKKPDLLRTLPEFNEQLIRCGAVLVHYRAPVCPAAAGICRRRPRQVLRRQGTADADLPHRFHRDRSPGGGGRSAGTAPGPYGGPCRR